MYLHISATRRELEIIVCKKIRKINDYRYLNQASEDEIYK